MKRGVLAEPVVARLEEAVYRSQMYPDCPLWGGGGYLGVPALCVRVDSMSLVLFCAKVSLVKTTAQGQLHVILWLNRGCLIGAWSSQAIMP